MEKAQPTETAAFVFVGQGVHLAEQPSVLQWLDSAVQCRGADVISQELTCFFVHRGGSCTLRVALNAIQYIKKENQPTWWFFAFESFFLHMLFSNALTLIHSCWTHPWRIIYIFYFRSCIFLFSTISADHLFLLCATTTTMSEWLSERLLCVN